MNGAAAHVDSPSGPADLLRRLVAGLGVTYGYERSLRLCHQAILPNRFLLSLSKNSLGERAHERVLGLCRQIRMPAEAMQTAAERLGAARFIHFGFEESASSCLYKLYLESRLPPDPPAGPDPILLHLAFKWDVSDPSRHVVSRYTWHPGLSSDDILGRLSQIYRHPRHERSMQIAREVVQLAKSRIDGGELRYMEVDEPGTCRRSFDLNLYDCRLFLRDVEPLLMRICDHQDIAWRSFESLYRRIEAEPLGHLAGGVHRSAEGFFNLYFGVEERQSSELPVGRSAAAGAGASA
jgi:tryptophan 7-halogenase